MLRVLETEDISFITIALLLGREGDEGKAFEMNDRNPDSLCWGCPRCIDKSKRYPSQDVVP